MNKKMRAIIAALVCAMILVVAIPVSAEEGNMSARNTPSTITCTTEGCGKTARYSHMSGMSEYKRVDDNYHSMMVEQIYVCGDRHTSIRKERMTETHGYDNYVDQGHVVDYHKYRITCKCGHYQEIQILCPNWETLGHKKPW